MHPGDGRGPYFARCGIASATSRWTEPATMMDSNFQSCRQKANPRIAASTHHPPFRRLVLLPIFGRTFMSATVHVWAPRQPDSEDGRTPPIKGRLRRCDSACQNTIS